MKLIYSSKCSSIQELLNDIHCIVIALCNKPVHIRIFAKWMGQPHLYGPNIPHNFFRPPAIASIGIALQNKCKGLFLKNLGGEI